MHLFTLQRRAEATFYQFLKQAWHTMNGGAEYTDGKHIEAICNHLEAVYYRKIKRLIINIPPRFGKSSIISVAFPAWVWLHNPCERFLCASYIIDFARRDTRQCRSLIRSPWYQRYWGDRFYLSVDQNTKGRFDNNYQGFRIATSTGGGTTGEGGSITIIDDPNNAKDGQSEAERKNRIEWWTQVMPSRSVDAKTDCKIVVQQRIHENDLSGYIIVNDENNIWTKLILPMEFEENKKSQTFINGKLWWEDWRTKDGELLWPERINHEELLEPKNTLGSFGYAGQYQQRPSPIEGGIIKKDWFKWWDRPTLPRFVMTLVSCDPAISDSATASYSACTTWGLFEDEDKVRNVILLSMWRGRVGYPDLRARLKRLAENYNDTHEKKREATFRPPTKIIIEAKATGDPLIRDLRLDNIMALPYAPKGDKGSRVQRISHLIESGIVWLPTIPSNSDKLMPWADEFVEEVASFPNKSSRDLVDTMSQILQYMVDSKLLYPIKTKSDDGR